MVNHFLQEKDTITKYYNYSHQQVTDWYEASYPFTVWLMAKGEIVLETNKGRFWGRTKDSLTIEAFEAEYSNSFKQPSLDWL